MRKVIRGATTLVGYSPHPAEPYVDLDVDMNVDKDIEEEKHKSKELEASRNSVDFAVKSS